MEAAQLYEGYDSEDLTLPEVTVEIRMLHGASEEPGKENYNTGS